MKNTAANDAGMLNLTIGTEASPLPADICWDRAKHFLEKGTDLGAGNE